MTKKSHFGLVFIDRMQPKNLFVREIKNKRVFLDPHHPLSNYPDLLYRGCSEVDLMDIYVQQVILKTVHSTNITM